MDIVTMTVERLQASELVGMPVYARKEPHKIDGTGGLYVVVKDAGPWGTSQHHTRLKRVVRVDLYADCERDEFNHPAEDDAAVRAWAAWAGIDRELHDLNHGWIAVCSSLRSDEPSEIDIPGAEYSVLLSGRYEVSV
ncbi:hypothetical protein [Aeromicrobium fastidiosum]|uniref:Uncharacterized protein n=1 Tax=Aeromicrobium fastidiosum TaxID=52699 RepID=A0A641AKA0_9ACTN|nr:hypothetical protein [Aeromicrobium fastidiosum]KAA1376116.1 hypothetical protein ESP62_011770 [Aeromicrobium fastidiosum]MBP2392005.1 hypothetical protein [Aeromicrobium fastidiosum]